MSDIVKVQFHGDTIEAIPGDATAWVVVKRVCDALGLAYAAQFEKLKGKPWATVSLIGMVAEDGKNRELFCVDLDSLPMWLATIEPSRVAPHVRPKLERYQKECARVLRDHFFGINTRPVHDLDVATVARVVGESLTIALRPILDRLEAVESGAGTITRDQLATIRHHVAAVARGRVHAGLAPSANSARRWVYNRLGSIAGWSGAGRAWSLLPAPRYADVLAELTSMNREVRAAVQALATQQLSIAGTDDDDDEPKKH